MSKNNYWSWDTTKGAQSCQIAESELLAYRSGRFTISMEGSPEPEIEGRSRDIYKAMKAAELAYDGGEIEQYDPNILAVANTVPALEQPTYQQPPSNYYPQQQGYYTGLPETNKWDFFTRTMYRTTAIWVIVMGILIVAFGLKVGLIIWLFCTIIFVVLSFRVPINIHVGSRYE